MKKSTQFIFLIILFAINFASLAQTDYKAYHKNLNKANTFKVADSLLKYKLIAIKKARPLPNDLLSVGFYFFEKKNLPKAKYYFLEAIKSGYQIEPDADFNDLPFKTEYDFSFISKYEKSNSPYAKFMTTMYAKNKNKIRKLRKNFVLNIDRIQDRNYEVLLQNELNFQKIRFEILPTKQVSDSVVRTLYKYLNIGNSYYMLELLQKNEFPSRYKCRRFNDQSFGMLVNHAIAGFAEKEEAKLFIYLLWKQVEMGNMSPYDYAKAIDHFTSWYVEAGKTLLGTVTFSEDFKTFQCIDVINPEELNELRDKYWLVPIEVFCKNTGYLLPKNYTEKY